MEILGYWVPSYGIPLFRNLRVGFMVLGFLVISLSCGIPGWILGSGIPNFGILVSGIPNPGIPSFGIPNTRIPSSGIFGLKIPAFGIPLPGFMFLGFLDLGS